ncbi:MAG: ROK family protein [Clostridia bacterium]|nr:ROK family protein [Clostridia bacterium]
MYLLGFDIGGTKCAVITARYENGELKLIGRESIPTDRTVSPYEMIDRLVKMADRILEEAPSAIGISCGNPLDTKNGKIMSPPNLPGWDNVEIVKVLEEHYGVRAYLQNDADACAIAEWRFGAGAGTQNMVFITFGTGFGAGLILGGRLYSGTNGNAGEVGHIRLDRFGPVGYGKAGSWEGFCSGGGISQLAYIKATEMTQTGKYPSFFKKGMTASDITAKSVAEAAREGDECALDVYRICGEYLGRGLSVVIDILNPERIVIGSIFTRSRDLLWNEADKQIKREVLAPSYECCEVVPAALGEQIGDYGAITVALYGEGIF